MESQLSLFDIGFENSIENNKVDETNKISSLDLKKDINISLTKSEKKQFIINEKVSLKYNGILYEGIVKHIYNNGDTINCTFDEGRKHSAFYVENINKLK